MRQPQAKDLLAKSGFKRASADATISSVIAQLRSSHDAVFIFRQGKFLGLINLYYSLLKRKPNSQEKAHRCLYKPPRLESETPLSEIARLMVESRVYILPVFAENGRFLGAVSYRRILRWLAKQPLLRMAASEGLTLKPPAMVLTGETIGRVRNLMTQLRTSRILVVDRLGRIKGIITAYDLRNVFSSPLDSVRFMSLAPQKKEIDDLPIERYYQRSLVTGFSSDRLKNMVELMLGGRVGSVVVVSATGKPEGIVSVREILKLAINTFGGRQELIATASLPSFYDSYDRERVTVRVKELIGRQKFFADKIADIRLVFNWLAKKRSTSPLLKIRVLAQTKNHQFFQADARGRKILPMIRQLVDRLERQAAKVWKK